MTDISHCGDRHITLWWQTYHIVMTIIT